MSSEDKEWLKNRLREKIEELSKEIDVLKMCLEILGEKTETPPQKVEIITKKVEGRKLLTTISEGDKNLANIYAEENKVIIVPNKNIRIDTNSREFKEFFIKKVLLGLKREKPAITYEIKDERGVLNEIVIKNIMEEKDIKRIEGAVKWTFSRFIKG